MKKYSIWGIILLLATSCTDFLDRFPLGTESNDTFWSTEAQANAALNGCYNDWYSMENIIYFDCASDNAYNPYPWEGWQVAASGAATSGDSGRDFFSYTSIARCNAFIANIDRVTSMSEAKRNQMKAEARFLRAFDYFMKVTLYGGVPLVTEPADMNADQARNTKEEVANFVIAESKEIAPLLAGTGKGHASTGAAYALKARMELFVGKYADAAASCQEVMKLGYSLMPDYKSIFLPENENNAEVILNVEYEESSYTNTILGVMPPSSSGGWSSIDPTQALVDNYECVDGKPISESTLYNPKDPYKNRDSRLAATIVYPGALYNGAYLNSIDQADPTGDYYAPYGRSKTGYYPRKYVDNKGLYADIWKSGMNGIVIRYAETLLTYAEAKIELNQLEQSVYDAINLVRLRAGLPEVDQTVYNNQTKMRELIRRERRSELAMEGIRWFDVCRWAIGEQVMKGKVYGALLGTVNPTTGDLALTDTRIEVETREFNANKHYLWAIPQKYIDATPAIKQNPNY